MKAVIDKVTEKAYGKATVAADVNEEVEITWGIVPTAITTTNSIYIAGSTTAAGYVYCMASKAGVE
jgi:hypothetical protein